MKGNRQGGSASGNATGNAPRMIGVLGAEPGPCPRVLETITSDYPDLQLIAGPAERICLFGDIQSGDFQVVTSDDGSFMALSGAWRAGRTMQEAFDAWLGRNEVALRDDYFQGLLAAWNAATDRFVLLRDRYGVETGYHADTPDGLAFSDEQRPLVALGADTTPDPIAIDAFLACGYFPAPLTPFHAIRKVPPGSALIVSSNGRTAEKWAPHESKPAIPYDEAVAMAPDVIRTAIERLWPSRGEVGLLLSGGIDSAMVLAGITEWLGETATAFTFRYEDYEGPLNESDAARIVTSHLGMRHEEIRIRPDDLIDDLGVAVAAYGEPLNWGLHSYHLDPIKTAGVSAVFSGVGADGTGITKRHQAALRFHNLPGPAQSLARLGVRAVQPLSLTAQAKAEWVTRKTKGVGDLFSPDSPLSRLRRSTLYRDPTLAEEGGRHIERIFAHEAASLDPADPRFALIILDKVFTSAEAMMAWNRVWPRAHGLGACLPFYDPDMIDLGLRVEGTTAGKDLIRKVAEGILPQEVATAPKIAQQIPVGHWLRGPIAGRAREILADLPSGMTEVFDQKQVLTLVDEHVSGKVDAGWRIISLLTIATWFGQR